MVENVLIRFGFDEFGPLDMRIKGVCLGFSRARPRKLLALAMKNNVVY
jgi:hypothetical protein